ncbi:MAG: Stk1 family PASTA domain-containing Ser/Thr kinase [Acidimicrobiales bacterium]|jgi:serine/threonine-protein kinase
MTMTPHTVVGGRYELGDQIARGGTAQVFLARDLLLGRPVALKMLFSELSTDSAFVERFRREAQAAANLSHPNIVPVFDWGETDSTYYIVMEYVDGEALSSIIRTQAPLTSAQAASVAADIAKALAYAHRHGVVHRDVKPGNVLITSDGQVKVTDFGIARAIGVDEQVTQTGLVMGTATYFSPEQAQGLGVDGRSDVYALGVVLYEMVAGRPPFVGESPVAIAYQHVRESPEPPSTYNPKVSPALEAIILQAMAKLPKERYQTAEEFRADLERFAHDQPIHARLHREEAPTVAVRTTEPAIPPAGSVPAAAAAATAGGAPPTAQRTTPYWLASGCVFAVAIGLVIYFGGHSLGYFGGARYFDVPNVEGLSTKAAIARLTRFGLDPRTKEVPGNARTEGKVVAQDPTSPGQVAKGQRVILDIALPPKNIDIPNVIGLNYFYAEAALHSHDFKWHVNLVLPTAPGLVQGQVVDEVPGPPALAPAGTRIALDVIRGTYTIAVPQVTGMTPAQADSAITGAGLTVGSSSNAHSPIVAQGLVISSSPAAGQKVPDGTAVHLLVSSGALVTVPFVVDETLQQAQQDLSSVGLQYLIIPIATSSPDQIGFVINQHPMSGQLVKPGFQVTLRVGVSNTSTTTTTTTTTTPTTPTS